MIFFRLQVPGIVYHPDLTRAVSDSFCFSIRGVDPRDFATAMLCDLVPSQEVWLPDPDRDCCRVVRKGNDGFETRLICHGAFNEEWRAVSREAAVSWLAPAAARMLATGGADGWIHWRPVADEPGAARPRFSEVWRTRYEAERTDILRMLDSDMWEGWASDPEMIVHLELTQGIRVLLGGDVAVARRYFLRGLTICDRSDRELPCAPPSDDMEPALAPAFPWNRATRARCRAHLRGFLEDPDAHDAAMREFRSAAEDLVAYDAHDQKGTWSEISQARTLDAVRFMLLVGDDEAAARILKTRRKFRFHAEEHAILRELTNGDRSPQLRERLLAFFDRIRDPLAKKDAYRDVALVPIETALLLDRLFDHPEGRLHWLRAAARRGR